MPAKPTVSTGPDLHDRRVKFFEASLREVAEAARVAPSTVRRWEMQSKLPRCPTGALRNILAVLSVRLFQKHKHKFEGPHEGNAHSPPGFVVCGAMTRGRTPCKRAPVPGRGRCRLHGGLSTGPKTPEGRERCAQAAKAPRPNTAQHTKLI